MVSAKFQSPSRPHNRKLDICPPWNRGWNFASFEAFPLWTQMCETNLKFLALLEYGSYKAKNTLNLSITLSRKVYLLNISIQLGFENYYSTLFISHQQDIVEANLVQTVARRSPFSELGCQFVATFPTIVQQIAFRGSQLTTINALVYNYLHNERRKIRRAALNTGHGAGNSPCR